ncbi:hypothetical protein IE077_001880 [Cardiosporidium cionae]|uniref:Saccharopine dehydrogenase NADP binding domain-containing protein n=1 Tax=Cardiosporidium cionae TaxID=476202 RepID=A0ABQ7JC69_9APIC|nr:hypothetical protein IE077_001880 [Cardiosporidium cionae]|eukprot:KAF8821554.1 hypothetical protein IE077_001880 [Cardiosporidium cionae]
MDFASTSGLALNFLFSTKEHKGNSMERTYDVVLWGVTGYTGNLAAKYMIEQYGIPSSYIAQWQKNNSRDEYSDVSSKERSEATSSDGIPLYAFAGRDIAKLTKVRDELSTSMKKPEVSSIPLLVADSMDYPSLLALTAQTKTIASFTGPFLRLGENLVRACVTNGTHYCDITGEFPFVKDMKEKFDVMAREQKVKIVHFCGFDSIPSDLGTLLLQEFAISKFGVPCSEIRFRILEMFGGISGGTIASAVGMHAARRSDKALYDNPLYLCSIDEEDGELYEANQTNRRALNVQTYEQEANYVAPFPMAPINSKVVWWTNYLLNYRYGKSFVYNEAMGNFGSSISASLYTLSLKLAMFFLRFAPIRMLLSKLFIPNPGEGPSEEKLRKGHFFARIFGKCLDASGCSHSISASVRCDGDPGYAGTAKMACESCLCVAFEEKACPSTYGVLSPAVAFGACLVVRLRAANILFRLDDESFDVLALESSFIAVLNKAAVTPAHRLDRNPYRKV